MYPSHLDIESRYLAKIVLAYECGLRGMSLDEFERDARTSLARRRMATEVFAGYGPRGIDGSQGIAGSQLAFGDEFFHEFVYNDTSGSLSVGQPLFVDVTDAAEYNTLYSGTAITSGKRTGGNVVLATNGNATNLFFVGIFDPSDKNFGLLPNKGDTVRARFFGRGLGSAVAKASGTAVLVGDVLIVDSTPTNNLLSGHNTYTSGKVAGIALATGSAVTTGASIIAVPGSSSTVALVNMFTRV